MKKTNRGFSIFSQFKDSYGQDIRVQESSGIGPNGGFVWIFCKKGDADGVEHLGRWQSYSPHLTRAQARRVAKALLKFADGK